MTKLEINAEVDRRYRDLNRWFFRERTATNEGYREFSQAIEKWRRDALSKLESTNGELRGAQGAA